MMIAAALGCYVFLFWHGAERGYVVGMSRAANLATSSAGFLMPTSWLRTQM